MVAVEGKDQRDKPGKMAGAGTWASGTAFREIYAKAHTSVYSWSSRETARAQCSKYRVQTRFSDRFSAPSPSPV